MTRDREAERQEALLDALWRGSDTGALDPWLHDAGSVLTQRGLQAYRANAGANAERALATSFPTVRALVGTDSFAALARALWRAMPPSRGDLAYFGESLSEFIAGDPRLADVPYLADVARLEWLLARAEAHADRGSDPESVALLAQHDPDTLVFELAPGLGVLRSNHPVVRIWRAHRSGDEADFAAARTALEAGAGENALVWRCGWKAEVEAIDETQAQWFEALLQDCGVGASLMAAPAGFEFEPWLLQALRSSWLCGVSKL